MVRDDKNMVHSNEALLFFDGRLHKVHLLRKSWLIICFLWAIHWLFLALSRSSLIYEERKKKGEFRVRSFERGQTKRLTSLRQFNSRVLSLSSLTALEISR